MTIGQIIQSKLQNLSQLMWLQFPCLLCTISSIPGDKKATNSRYGISAILRDFLNLSIFVREYHIENPSQKWILLSDNMFDYIVRLLVWAVEGVGKVSQRHVRTWCNNQISAFSGLLLLYYIVVYGYLVSCVLASGTFRHGAFIYYCASFRLCKRGQWRLPEP